MSRDVCGICWCPYDEDGKCGCKPAQPEALRISDQLDDAGIPAWMAEEAATELRRLNAENEALRCQKLQAVADQADQMTMDEALLRQALEALEWSNEYLETLGEKLFPESKKPQPGSTTWHVHKAIAAIKERLNG